MLFVVFFACFAVIRGAPVEVAEGEVLLEGVKVRGVPFGPKNRTGYVYYGIRYGIAKRFQAR